MERVESAAVPLAKRKGLSSEARRYIGFFSMVFGMFMAILDIQIVSASLAEIQAGLSASAEQISWVQTSYLIAEVVMIPLSGLLARALSTRYMFVISAAGFTLMSFMCATSTSIEQMIVWRAAQGFIGGGMIPTVFASAYTVFPREKQAMITASVGLVAMLAPTIGPTIGGYLTDLFNWRWLFFVNIPPGIVVIAVCWLFVDFDEPKVALLDTFDWVGLISMAVFLGALEYCLEEGPAKNWFDEDIIVYAATASILGAVVFFSRVLTAAFPIVDLGAFGNRNFWTGSLLSGILGIGLYGLTYLYPVYLARVRGYSALMIGETMFVSGLTMLIAAPIAGRLAARIDPRLMIGVGLLGFSFGVFEASHVTKDWDFRELILPQVFRGVSLMLCIIPVNNLALGTMSPDRMKNASGLFNLTRNLGGAIGLAIINTMINKRLDLHLARLQELVSWGNARALETLSTLTQAFAGRRPDAELAATKQLALLVRREALAMSLGDVFLALAVLFLAALALVPLMRQPREPVVGGGH